MPDLSPKSLFPFHLLGFSLVFIFTCVFLLYQVCVNSSYQRIPLKQFIKPSVLTKAVTGLIFKRSLPQKPESVKQTVRVEVDCREFCQFNLIDTKTNSVIKTLPARVDIDASGRLKALKLFFVDSQSGLIGYQNNSLADPTFYVINFQADLLQVVKLSLNHQINFEFLDYYPSTQQMLFKSLNSSNRQEELFLYAANRPALQLL